MKRTFLGIALGSILVIPTPAQNVARPLITAPIDETQRTVLHGNVSPLAQAAYDQGPVEDSRPASRVLLMLNRPPEREAALQQYLAEVHSKGSPTYHHWLTPQVFGEQFGPADSDIETVTAWLRSKGFRITKVSQGKQFIEFSGTMGQLRDSFQADLHQYNINGEIHFANSREISIPTALAAVVRGLAPLNDFRSKTYVRLGGTARYSRATHTVTPDWTIANPFGTANPLAFLVAPEDLATQYDLTPLYQAGTNGTGQTIGIIDASNIDINLVSDFQQFFGLASNPPQVIIDGDDPGDVADGGDDVETYLDVEISGAIAPKSTVNLYISDGGSLGDPFAFASIRAVEDNAASVLSASFGQCEEILGDSGNQFWASLWEQAAAQGQTAMVATGDSGPTCDGILPNAVSGLASTPWNVAVGGTDFFYSDYATGGASAPTFWNATNDANLGSLKAPLQEQTWDDGFGLNIISNGLERNEIGAGGGGPSNCATSSAGTCLAGNPKPSWQNGAGVPSDGVRDIPDVAFYASNGANLSAYAICAFEGECTTEPATDAEVLFVGGTSASAPAMAGIMALVNQKFGRQGQADFTFYALAKQKPAAFHDITEGGNTVPCDQGDANCALNGAGAYETTVYLSGPGYDLATGLGTVDANVLVSSWDSIIFEPTTTTLKLSPTTITHGTPVNVTTTVSSNAGTPTGNVAILTSSPEPANQSQTFVTLSDGSGSDSVNFFPGGTYQVTAQYGGDGTFGASTSAPVTLNVSPEKSVISVEVVNNGTGYAASGFSIPYNSPVSVNVLPTSVSAASGGHTDGIATGTATFMVDSTSATVPLDGQGVADFSPPALATGSHTVSATYSGDASFDPSTASPISFTVSKGNPVLNDNVYAPQPGPGPVCVINPGSSLTVTAQVSAFLPLNGAAAPTGTVMACLGTTQIPCLNPVYTQSGTLAPPMGLYAQMSTATVTFPNLAAGYYIFSFTYSGDMNWQSTSLVDIDEINVQAPAALAATTNALSLTPSTISGNQLTQASTTITGAGNSGVAPSGNVVYYDNGVVMVVAPLAPTGPQTSNVTLLLGTGYFFANGANQITVIYQGDKNYLPSTSNTVSVNVTQVVGNFTMTPSASEITLPPGNSTSIGIGLASAGNFNGTVNMSCSTSSPNITCSVPASTSLNGLATSMLMITASSQAELNPYAPTRPPTSPSPSGGIAVTLASLLLMTLAIRTRRAALIGAELFTAIVLMSACGGGSSSQPPPPPPPAPATYSVVVNATGNGILHAATIRVFVP